MTTMMQSVEESIVKLAEKGANDKQEIKAELVELGERMRALEKTLEVKFEMVLKLFRQHPAPPTASQTLGASSSNARIQSPLHTNHYNASSGDPNPGYPPAISAPGQGAPATGGATSGEPGGSLQGGPHWARNHPYLVFDARNVSGNPLQPNFNPRWPRTVEEVNFLKIEVPEEEIGILKRKDGIHKYRKKGKMNRTVMTDLFMKARMTLGKEG